MIFLDDFERQAGEVVSRLRHDVQHLPQGVFRKSPESQSGDQKCRFSCVKQISPQKMSQIVSVAGSNCEDEALRDATVTFVLEVELGGEVFLRQHRAVGCATPCEWPRHSSLETNTNKTIWKKMNRLPTRTWEMRWQWNERSHSDDENWMEHY